MGRTALCAVIFYASFLFCAGANAEAWSYRAYEQDGVRWHTLSLEDHGYRLAFFCHGASDGIKVTLRTPDPVFLPTAFSAANRSAAMEDLRLANREVIAGPYYSSLTVDQNSSYELQLFHVSFYGVLARNDGAYSLSDLLDHLRTARTVSLTRVGDESLGPDRPLATFDLTETDGAFNRLYDLCGAPAPAPAPTAGLNASR